LPDLAPTFLEVGGLKPPAVMTGRSLVSLLRSTKSGYDFEMEALLSAIPMPDPEREKQRTILSGDVPSPLNPPSGCRFHPRCPIARLSHCSVEGPQLRELRPNHWVACHYAEDYL